MARLHSTMGDRTCYTSDGTVRAQGLPAIVYTDADATTLADLSEYDPDAPGTPGAAITGAALTVDEYSNLPAFWDNDDLDVLYVAVNGGTTAPIFPDAQPQITAHLADTTAVHGIADTSGLETTTGATAKVTAHAAAVDPHADRAYTDTTIATHTADTTSVHGITDTSALVLNTRTITAGTGLTGGGDLSANRTLTVAYGTTGTTATVGNDSRVVNRSVGYVFEAPAGAVTRVIDLTSTAITVTAVRAYRVGGTGATITARGAGLTLIPVDLSVTSTATWMTAPSLQNTAVASGQPLQLEVTGVTGTPSYVVVTIDYQVA